VRHRLRVLSAARKERIGRIVMARKQLKSLRAIAIEERVSEAQVRLDLKRAKAMGYEVPAPETVMGLDGLRRPGTRPKTNDSPIAPTAPVRRNGSEVETPASGQSSIAKARRHSPTGAPHSPTSEMPRPALCGSCLLAHHRGLVVHSSVLEASWPPPPPDVLNWYHCQECNVRFQGPQPRYGSPLLCPSCAKPKGCWECKGLEGAHEPHCRQGDSVIACERCGRPVITDAQWRRCRGYPERCLTSTVAEPEAPQIEAPPPSAAVPRSTCRGCGARVMDPSRCWQCGNSINSLPNVTVLHRSLSQALPPLGYTPL
jgi:hypothetical protein